MMSDQAMQERERAEQVRRAVEELTRHLESSGAGCCKGAVD